MAVGGEIDMVKPSPRPNGQDSKQQNGQNGNKGGNKNAFMGKNGINLSEAQLAAILNAIQNNEINIKTGMCSSPFSDNRNRQNS